ncbi:CPBP family intramembrane metalloprotease [Candidatus Saccharibacteria bacterium]|nr:CPBP family intramembrane metalloprotease [Candidatus Saccharibacteria bacterium]
MSKRKETNKFLAGIRSHDVRPLGRVSEAKDEATRPVTTGPRSVRQKLCLFLIILIMLFWTGFCFLFSQWFVAFLAIRVFGLTSAQFQEPFNLAIYDLVNYSLMVFLNVGLPYLFFKTHKISKKYKTLKVTRDNLGLKDLPTWKDIGLAPAGFFVYFILAAILTATFSAIFPWFDAGQTQDVGFNSLYSSFDRLAAFFALVVVAPVAEEVIFRGWLYGQLRALIPAKINLPFIKKSTKKYQFPLSLVLSMLIVSALFGLLHLQWNVGINVFCLSLVLCALREVTGTIYSGILLHMFKNGIAFYLLYVINML